MDEVYQELANIDAHGGKAVLATIISAKGSAPRGAGAKMLIKADGSFVGTVGGGSVEEAVKHAAAEVLKNREPRLLHFDMSGTGADCAMICGGQVDVFLEPLAPTETLYLFGAGHISQATAVIGRMLGFRVVVTDPRPEYTNAEKFPTADALYPEDYESAFKKLPFDERSYIIIYTPGHVMDEQCLHLAVGTPAYYIGMIGSKKKVLETKQRLIKKGVPPEKLAQVHSPIGLPIGAETPEEIAISIMAEVVQVRRAAKPA